MAAAHATLFGQEWEEAMERAREAFRDRARIEREAKAVMAESTNPSATAVALDKMNTAATNAHKIWVEANPIRWARTRGANHLSVNALVPLVGLSAPALFSWEHGNVENPDPAPMRAIEEKLGEPLLGELWRRWRAIPNEESN